jgi:hypothetical protein
LSKEDFSLAFDELGTGVSKSTAQNYTVNAAGLVSRTFGVWKRQFVQYVIIFGIPGAVAIATSFLMLLFIFGSIVIVGTDPVSYFFGLFASASLPSPTLIAVSLLLAVILFIFYAIIGGAAIKYALDDYASRTGDVRSSYSHAYRKSFNFVIAQLAVSVLTSVPLYPGLILLTNAISGIDISDPFNPIISPGAMESMMFGSILLLVGVPIALYLIARFSPTVAIVIDTDLSAINSLKRSWELTGGHVLHVIAGRILLGICVILLGIILSAIPWLLSLSSLGQYGLVTENIVSTLLFGVLNYIFPVILYRDLSSRVKESSLESLLL